MEINSPDWPAIRRAYEAGTKSKRQIAKDFGISESYLRKKANEEGWVYGNEGAHQAAHSPAHQPGPSRAAVVWSEPDTTAPAAARSSDAIEKAAEVDPEDLAKEGLVVLQMLLAEIKAEGVNADWLETIIEEETADDKSPQRYRVLMKAVSAPVRAQAAKNIVLALQTLAAMGPGKKATAKAAAKEVGTGRFATPTAPGSFKSQTVQ